MDELNSAEERTRALVYDVFKATWEAFYAWEHAETRHMLASLRAPSAAFVASTDPESFGIGDKELVEEIPTIRAFDSACEETISIWDASNPTSTSLLEIEVVEAPPPIDAYPVYEACTPATRNIMVEDDPVRMSFFPHADDPTFKFEDYMAEYEKGFQWQGNEQDPDLEVIVAQATRVLYQEHQMPLHHIDETDVFPLRILGDSAAGFIRTSQFRDFPKWPPDVNYHSPTLYDFGGFPADDLKRTVINLNRYFCGNLNCLLGYCVVHMNEMEPPIPKEPRKKSEHLARYVEKPCGENCFVLGRYKSDITYWDDATVEALRITLEYEPDISPCDLAIICRKPCNEAFGERKKFIIPTSNSRRSQPQNPYPIFDDIHPASMTGPVKPINAYVSRTTPIVKVVVDAQGNVIADGKVVIVVPNLDSAKRIAVPVTQLGGNATPSFVNRAVPNYATSCCNNIVLQKGVYKATEVKQSEFGLGLFAAENINEGDFIIEYTGEIILEPTVKTRDHIARHRGRGYLFTLNESYGLDASYAGNESRYINHHATLNNCYAHVRLVNGEHRIAMHAAEDPIPKGAEILFDYGPRFFRSAESNAAMDNQKPLPRKGKQRKEKRKRKGVSGSGYSSSAAQPAQGWSKGPSQKKSKSSPPLLVDAPPARSPIQGGEEDPQSSQHQSQTKTQSQTKSSSNSQPSATSSQLEQQQLLATLDPRLLDLDQHSSDENYDDDRSGSRSTSQQSWVGSDEIGHGTAGADGANENAEGDGGGWTAAKLRKRKGRGL